jgi:hypothetical protein
VNYSVVVTNLWGATTSAVATLTVVDSMPPSIVCPSNVVVSTDPSQCSALVSYSVTATDNCAVASLLVLPPSGSAFPKGTNAVLCLAVDCGGNSNTCSFNVIVLDHEPPVLSCPTNQVLSCTSSNGARGFFASTAIDNCDGTVAVISSPPSGSYFSLGTNIVTCVTADSVGNSNYCTFTITVVETPPVLTITLNDTNCVLAWPQGCASYSIEHRSSLDPAEPWIGLALTPTLSSGVFSVTNPLGSSNDFFRLVKAP